MPTGNAQKGLPATALDAVDGMDLTGQVFVVTGGYSGLGAETSRVLLGAGAKVVVAGRTARSQAEFAEAMVGQSSGGEQPIAAEQIDTTHALDLGSLASVAEFARYVDDTYPQIACLVNNAGVMNTPPGETEDGFDVQMGTNVIGHFLLAKRLAPKTARQVWLSSSGHALIGDPPGNHDPDKAPRIDLDAIATVDPSAYDSWRRYQQSKLGAILLAKQFAVEFPHLKTCSVHPGVVRTNLSRHTSSWLLLKYFWAMVTGRGQRIVTPDEGARTQVLCAVMPEAALETGAYYSECQVTKPAKAAENAEDAARLYAYCDSATRPFQTQPMTA
ncbi:MAG: SDR family NAD(P)-dependent oxidoreductase [Pseudomonadota bacterium]